MKVIQHSINGVVYTLDFGRMNFLKFMGERLGIDPLSNMSELVSDMNKQYEFITALFYSGVNTYSLANGKEPISVDDAGIIIGNASQEEASELVEKFTNSMMTKQGEGIVLPGSQSDGTTSEPKHSDTLA